MTNTRRARLALTTALAWAKAHGFYSRAKAIQKAIDSLPGGVLSGHKALAWAKHQSQHGPQFGTGECLEQVENAYEQGAGIPLKRRELTAADAWASALHKHHETDPTKIPTGAPTFWLGGASGFGHVAIKEDRTHVESTDSVFQTGVRNGFFDRIPVTQVDAQWPGHRLVGWTNDLAGVVVFSEDTKEIT